MIINAGALRDGDVVRWLGEQRIVKSVKRSLGNGWVVIFTDGLTANMSSTWRFRGIYTSN